MKLNTEAAVREVFRKALQQELTGYLKRDQDWERFHQIAAETKQRLADEENAWQSDYPKRFAEAQQIILREAHGNVLKPPTPEGVGAIPDKATLDLKADQRIRQDHERRLAVIQRDEIDAFGDFRDALVARDALKGHTRTAFEQARQLERGGPSRT